MAFKGDFIGENTGSLTDLDDLIWVEFVWITGFEVCEIMWWERDCWNYLNYRLVIVTSQGLVYLSYSYSKTLFY